MAVCPKFVACCCSIATFIIMIIADEVVVVDIYLWVVKCCMWILFSIQRSTTTPSPTTTRIATSWKVVDLFSWMNWKFFSKMFEDHVLPLKRFSWVSLVFIRFLLQFFLSKFLFILVCVGVVFVVLFAKLLFAISLEIIWVHTPDRPIEISTYAHSFAKEKTVSGFWDCFRFFSFLNCSFIITYYKKQSSLKSPLLIRLYFVVNRSKKATNLLKLDRITVVEIIVLRSGFYESIEKGDIQFYKVHIIIFISISILQPT